MPVTHDPLQYTPKSAQAVIREVFAELQGRGAKLVPVYNRPILHREGCSSRTKLTLARDVQLRDVASAYDGLCGLGRDHVRVCATCLRAQRIKLAKEVV